MQIPTEGDPGTETAGILLRPPLLVLGWLVLAHLLDHLFPLAIDIPENHVLRHTVSGALTLVGITLLVAGMSNFVRAGTPVPSNQPTRTLVTTGIHGWSRNPIYLGMLLFYLGVGVLLRGAWILVLLLPLIIALRYGVIAKEEAYLAGRFGDAYDDYKVRVRRWL